MLNRFMLVRFVTALAIGAMVSFVGVGCGDDDNAQKDAAVLHDAAQDSQHDAKQDDAAQADAANPSGTVVVLKASPQTSGDPQIDGMFGPLRLSYVSATWDSLNDQDNPTTLLDSRGGTPFGCYAKYYKKGQAGYDGGTTAYLPDNANAGDLTVSGYTHGVYYLGLDDGGVPITMPFADTITCKREEYAVRDDAGVTDAGTGRYQYNCDNEVNLQPVPVIPATADGEAFLAPGVDKLEIKATGGGLEVAAFDLTNVDVFPFIKIMPDGLLWALPTFAQNPAYNDDAGVPFHYACGDTDAGVDTAKCNGALAIQILWTDRAYAPGLDSLGTLEYDNERGEIQCSKVSAANEFTIPWEVWNAAVPPGSSPHTIQSFVLHFSVKQANGGTTTVGAGGGQIGVTWQ